LWVVLQFRETKHDDKVGEMKNDRKVKQVAFRFPPLQVRSFGIKDLAVDFSQVFEE